MQVDFTYPDKPVSAVSLLTAEFDDRLLPGETVTGINTSMAIFTGNDTNPAAMLIGSPTYSGNTASQSVGNGTPGNIYVLIWYASTSMSHLIQKCGRVAVIPDGSPY